MEVCLKVASNQFPVSFSDKDAWNQDSLRHARSVELTAMFLSPLGHTPAMLPSQFLKLIVLTLLAATCTVLRVHANDTISWNAAANRVSADLRSLGLSNVLEQVATATGWQVYLEPGTTHDVSAKFKDLPPGEALHLLLGDLNFALLPQTNAYSRLYVFRTSQRNATQLIRPAASRTGSGNPKVIKNELIVRLKPGAKIEDLARALGAKITGRIDALNTYRLEFADEAAARAARESILNDPDVESIDFNFSVDFPPTPRLLADGPGLDWNLKLKDPSGPCQIVVGLVDTPLGPLGNGLDVFLLPAISVADGAKTPVNGLTHGTAMAETILQSLQATSGGQTSVRILPVDVYGSSPGTTMFQVGQGIYAAATQPTNPANVFNLSLGGAGDSAFLHGLISSLSKQGVVFFGAAGNEPLTSPTYPAAYPEVIAVTASDPNGQVASYANRGSFVSIMEPGTSLVSFQGRSYLVSGTSTATALASGFAAGLADTSHNCPDQVIPAVRSKLGVTFNPAP